MNNISHIHSCYGCAVCAIACPKKIIDVRLNSNGFYEPYITLYYNGAKCVNCGLCLEVCSYNHSEIALNELPKVSYGAWSKEKSVRHICASGGVGFEIGRYLIGKGYKAIGVKYDVKRAKAEHYVASSVDEFIYNPQIQISVVSGTKRSIFRQKNKTKRSKKRLHTTLIKPEQKVNEDLCSGFIVS